MNTPIPPAGDMLPINVVPAPSSTAPARIDTAPLQPLQDLSAMRRVRPPVMARRLAIWMLVTLAIIPIVLVATPWQQVAVGTGRIIAFAPLDRQQDIEAPVEGRVVRWHVREGSSVRQGDPIADIQDLDPALVSRLQEERAAVNARATAAEARAASLRKRLGSLALSANRAVAAASDRGLMAADRVQAAEDARTAAAAAVETARLNLDRQVALAALGLSSSRTLELAQLDVTRATTERGRANAASNAARAERRALNTDVLRAQSDGSATLSDVEAGIASAASELASARAEIVRLDVRIARQAAQAVKAPRDGTILRLHVNQGGEMVKSGEPLAVLVPSAVQNSVELLIKGNDLPLVSLGRAVRLQFEGWPALQFSGWPSVAVGTFGGVVSLVDSTDDGSGRFRVLVTPDGHSPWPEMRYLRQGVRANGWILLSVVPLGYELWRQFNGFPLSFPADATKPSDSDKATQPAKRLSK